MQNQLSPTLIEDPGRFTGWSVNQLVKEVQKGQQTFINKSNEGDKKNTFLEFLRVKLKITKDLELNLRAEFDIGELSKSENGKEYILDHLASIYEEILPKIRNTETIDLIFNEFPPHDLDLDFAMKNCAFYENDYMACKLLNTCYTNPQQSLQMQAHPVLDLLIRCFNAIQVKHLFEGFELNDQEFKGMDDLLFLSSNDIREVLLYPLSTFANQTTHFLFRNLLIIEKGDNLEYLLKKLNPEDLEDVLSQDMHGINGMQLIALFHPTLIDYCLEQLPAKKLKSLLGEEITTTRDEEINQLHEISLIDIANNLKSSHKLASLKQHGLYAESKTGKKDSEEKVEIKKKPITP